MQSASDISTLVSSIREDMNREFQAHTDIINALKDEITQLREPREPNLTTIQVTEHQNIVQSLRQEIQELRQALPLHPPKASTNDFSQLISSVVESMIPLITAAVQQGLETDTEDSTKRSRPLGSTPTQFRHPHLQPFNLLDSFTSSSDPIVHPDGAPTISRQNPTNSKEPISPTARMSDHMEE